jgi:hypothetical protein
MKVKTSEAKEQVLGCLVAKCEGLEIYFEDGLVCLVGQPFDTYWKYWNPTTDWAQGGPIIGQEKISVWARDNEWAAESFVPNQQGFECVGPTPLIAAMRCYVTSQLGEEVEVPDELIGVKLCS